MQIQRHKVERIIDSGASPINGKVKWSPSKSIFVLSMNIGAIIGGYFYFTLEAFLLFALTTSFILCMGHSLGMHRRLIHNSFECPLWLEYFMVYCGTLVGLGGPFSMIKTHDMRDWAQREPKCHGYFAHRQNFWRDAWWQMHCDLNLEHPPQIQYESRIIGNKFYNLLDKTYILQHLPWAILFFAIGGWAWVFWGVCARVTACITGHWLIGYFAHSDEPVDWHVKGAGVQGHNVKFTGLLTMGECWHNNHHAFPGSAKIGIYPGQVDPGWWVLKTLEYLGLAWNIKTPADLPERHELEWLEKSEAIHHQVCTN